MKNVVIVDSVRTGLSKSFRGTFNMTRGDDMVAHCINALLDRNKNLDPNSVEDIIMDYCIRFYLITWYCPIIRFTSIFIF